MSVQDFEFYFEEPKELQLQFDHQYQPLFEFDEIDCKKIYEDPEFSYNFKFNFDFEINKFNGNFKLFENEMNLITFEEKAKDEFEYQFDHHQELWECGEQQKSNSVKFEEEKDIEPFQHSSNNLNLNLTVLSGSESNLIYNKSGSIRKKIGRKPVFTGLQQRKDVVLKSLLRKIHSFYWKDINHETNYIKQKKKRGVQYFEECLKIYIQNKLNEEPTESLMLTLGSIACSNDMKDMISHKSLLQMKTAQRQEKMQLNIVSQIYDTLYKFSLSKFSTLARRSEILKIMSYFVARFENSLTEDEKIGVQILINECNNE